MKKVKCQWPMIVLGFLFFALMAVDTVSAADVTLTPALRVTGEYDDNIGFSKTDQKEDFKVIIGPSLSYSHGSDRAKITARAAVDFHQYLEEEDYNDEKITFKTVGEFKVTERLNLSVDADYIKDTTLDSLLDETGRVFFREDRQLYSAGGGLDYTLTERVNTGANYRFRLSDIDSDNYEDYTTHNVSGFLGYKLKNQIDTLFLSPGYVYTDLETKDVQTFSANIAWERRVSEIFRIRTSIGQRYTKQQLDGRQDDQTSDGWVADIRLTRTGEITTVVLGYSRDLAVDALGALRELDKFYVQFNRRLLERLTLNISGGLYFSSRDIDTNVKNDTTYYTISPVLSYQLAERYFLGLGYRYSHSEEDAFDDLSASRNQVWLSLTFQLPMKW